jgi:hypothetical protein
MNKFALAAGFGVLSVSVLSAQEVSRFSFDLGAGFTQPVGNTGRYLDRGWNIQGGVGFNFSSYVGAMLQLDFNDLGINSGTLQNLGFPGGDVHVFSATVDPIVHLNPKGHVDMYLIGGGGLYRREQQFTAPAVAGVTGFNPFFGFFPAEAPATAILSSYSVNKPGWNGGAGVAFGTKWHGKIFAEARYVHIFGNGTHTDYVPVTFGYRW